MATASHPPSAGPAGPPIDPAVPPAASAEPHPGGSLERLAARLPAPFAILAGAILLRLIGGVGFANYDTLYALVWGGQLARGTDPQYGIPIAPTPHPLVEALGFVLSPLPPRAIESVTVALGFLALAACAWAVYRLGALWFNRAAGAVAALLLITRVPILSYGVRAYVDLPYLLAILAALVVETRRPRAGAPVLALLALAGLLRPEAWVFSGLYWLYIALAGRVAAPRIWVKLAAGGDTQAATSTVAGRDAAQWRGAAAEHSSAARQGAGPPQSTNQAGGERPEPRTPRQLARLALLALAAPLVWVGSDWLVTGDPMWSLINTRHTAVTLGRETGLAKVPEYIPRRIGEVLGPAALAGAVLGGVLAVLWLRRRALPGALVGLLAVVVLAVFATAGLPIDTRYVFVPAALLCVFCGASLAGWTLLAPSDPRRRWWAAGAALVALALLITAPSQYRVDHKELDELGVQQRIQNDLVALVHSGALGTTCEPIGVPNHAPIPLLALYLEADPSQIPSAQAATRPLAHGSYLQPATGEVQRHYILDLSERARPVRVPPGFAPTAANRSWRVYQRCL
ncbi:MAG TPA: hypothetical protein VMS02_06985 [Solirubrobacteraceae bacterium]|nr:hypothetical protein [Solirubrobacteraceae bacterium]